MVTIATVMWHIDVKYSSHSVINVNTQTIVDGLTLTRKTSSDSTEETV